jgi:hypothetical protein
MNTVTMIAIAMAIATMMGGRGLLTGASYRAGPAATCRPRHVGPEWGGPEGRDPCDEGL